LKVRPQPPIDVSYDGSTVVSGDYEVQSSWLPLIVQVSCRSRLMFFRRHAVPLPRCRPVPFISLNLCVERVRLGNQAPLQIAATPPTRQIPWSTRVTGSRL